MDPIQLSERILFPSMFHESSILLSSKFIFVCLTKSNKFHRPTPEISPCFHGVVTSFGRVSNSAFFSAQSRPLRSAKGTTPRFKVLTLCELLVFGNHLRKEKRRLRAPCLFHLLWTSISTRRCSQCRASPRDGQVSSPTSS